MSISGGCQFLSDWARALSLIEAVKCLKLNAQLFFFLQWFCGQQVRFKTRALVWRSGFQQRVLAYGWKLDNNVGAGKD